MHRIGTEGWMQPEGVKMQEKIAQVVFAVLIPVMAVQYVCLLVGGLVKVFG